MYNPPINTDYAHFYVTDNVHKIMPLVIGKNGYFFKKITTKTNMLYIWYNDKKIELWGPHSHIENAKNKIKNRIEIFINR